MTEVLVFTQYSSSRLQYTLHWVLSERLGLDFKITDSTHEFESSQLPKINYSNQTFGSGLNIYSSSVLYDTHIDENYGEIGEWKGIKTIFNTGNGEIPFDVFGAVFYLISRMEEYGDNELDNHQRYKSSNSILYKLNVLHTPIVDLWLEEFKIIFNKYYPLVEYKKEQFNFINTFDIDQAFCYKGKGLYRNAGGLLRDILRLNVSSVLERLLVLSGFKPDPFNTFDYIIKIHNELQLNSIVFLLLADNTIYDKNISISDSRFMEGVKLLNVYLNLGIHPSYNTFNDEALIRKEIERLVNLQKKPVNQSRQHYLRFSLPNTYRLLLDAGIRHEYSLGYPEVPGFRAGTAHPFHWFDMEKNEVTLLEIHPCCIMDVTLKNYLQLSKAQALEMINNLIDAVEKVNGTFIPIWHNESVSDFGEWKGWKEVYEKMVFKCSYLS